MDRELEYRVVLAVDIERSAGRGNTALLRIREVLATALREAFGQSGIDWAACLCEDLGDGLRVTAPAGTPKSRMIHPLVHELVARLRAHNRTAGAATRIRVRIALHAGDLWIAPDGSVAGRPLEVLARLLDAAPARRALAAAPAAVDASLIVSRHIHEETVGHGHPGIDPETFREVVVTAKEFTDAAWLQLVGRSTAVPEPVAAPEPVPHAVPEPVAVPEPEPVAAPERTAVTERPGRERSSMVNRASGHGVIYAAQHGVQHIHISRET
ncbi:hypothetical protein OG455_01510 [Kitasatospora sp. NBC_01287]|uniref:hypothetical protein n=1 Tax=Kitasatospora sp. NBC_01287 TaxID=2903573 RepID=UPI002250FE05|nr:hypothetical protein [Kitasatospora sp. NBC_01287]MCX4744202.1 hypothetical protein [Kitasatospora sp. NBC_01287]